MVVFVGGLGLGLGSWVLRTWDFGLWAGCRPKASEDESFRVGVLSTQVGEVLARTWAKVIACRWVWREEEKDLPIPKCICVCVFHLHINREAIAGPRSYCSWPSLVFIKPKTPQNGCTSMGGGLDGDGGFVPSNKCKMLLMKPGAQRRSQREQKNL